MVFAPPALSQVAEAPAGPEPAAPAPAEASPQEVAPEKTGADPAPAAPPADDDPAAVTTASANAGAADTASQLAELKAQLDAQAAAIAELQAAKEEAEMAALLTEGEAEPESDPLRFYGFMDMGMQRAWANKKSLVASVLPMNATSFVIGNINLYADAEPAPNWRALTEIHFTNAPQGEVEEYGLVLGGTTITEFRRNNVEQYDPHGAAANSPLWPGSIAIERAWIEYNEYQYAKLRVGNFFTPFGIWNVDHGTPTLISLAMPQLILQKFIPIRQTGIQVYGNTFEGDWELGYHLTLTNGRQELSNFDYDDDKGFGGRLYARHQGESTTTKLGVSGYIGDSENQVLNVVNLAPLEFEQISTLAYKEYIIGGDVSVDAGGFRFRTEGLVRRLVYEEGKRPDLGFNLPGEVPDSYQYTGYALAAYDLGFWGLEPYFYAEMTQRPSRLIGDAIFLLSPGLNIQINPATKLKFQVTHAEFRNLLEDLPDGEDPSVHNVNSGYARLVVAF